jgi:cyclophilin family peptidyl-prolyl cis-trans isomerase
MGTEKRARQKERGRTRAEEARKQHAATKRKRRIVNIGLLAILVIAVVGLMTFLSGNDEDTKAAESPGGSTTTAASMTSGPSGSGACPKSGDQTTPTFTSAPPMSIDTAKKYNAAVTTSKGAFTIQLDPAAAPKTVNNFVFLANSKFYDCVVFHRIIKDFMIQTGDPQGTGAGGPGYEFEDELPAAGAYKKYSVAMANSGANTNGSQFFVVTGAQGESLPPKYSLFGQVTEGMDTVDKIAATPVAQSASGENSKPTEQVFIESVVISEAAG